MHKNILTVVGITILFLGISINPAVAVNPINSDNEEDCSICPKISSLHLVRLKSFIDRLEINDNKLSVISKYHPKVKEKYQELSDRIRTLKEMNKEIKPEHPYPIICSILFSITFLFFSISYIMYAMFEGKIIFIILFPLFFSLEFISMFTLFVLGNRIGCWDWPPNNHITLN